jgi:hypothetical protein
LTDGHGHKQITADIKAGETLLLGPSDISLERGKTLVEVNVFPADAIITYWGQDGSSHTVLGGKLLELEEGQYTFTATANGYIDATQSIITDRNRKHINLTLTPKSAHPNLGP